MILQVVGLVLLGLLLFYLFLYGCAWVFSRWAEIEERKSKPQAMFTDHGDLAERRETFHSAQESQEP